jgi:hypothetical protein
MAVSDTQVATLRAYLQEDGESGYKAERVLLDRQAADSIAYGALLAAAFSEAVKRRFATRTTSWRVVKYVADVRSRSTRTANAVNPRKAERLILEALGEGTTADIDGKTSAWLKLALLAALMEEASLNSEQLDEFLAKVTEMADQLLG